MKNKPHYVRPCTECAVCTRRSGYRSTECTKIGKNSIYVSRKRKSVYNCPYMRRVAYVKSERSFLTRRRHVTECAADCNTRIFCRLGSRNGMDSIRWHYVHRYRFIIIFPPTTVVSGKIFRKESDRRGTRHCGYTAPHHSLVFHALNRFTVRQQRS